MSSNLITTKNILQALFFMSLCAGTADMAMAKDATEPPLTPQELADTAHRKECKFTICSIFASKKMDGPDVACDIAKTVRKAKIEKKYLRGKVSWPWGNARCKTNISVKREMLVKAMTEDGYELKLSKHSLSCELFKQDGKEKYELNLSVTPVIKWQGGKAESVKLNISDITGAALAKGGLWTIAKANSYFGVLDGPVKDKVNEFVVEDCQELLAKASK